MDRITAIKSIAYNLNDLILDATVASAYATAMRFTELIHPNARQLQGQYSYIYEGGGIGQSRVIGTLNPTNRELLFTQVFSPVPSTNSKVILTEFWDKARYDNALDRIIGKARLQYLEERVATISLVGTQYEYAVPSGFKYVNNLRLVPSASSDYDIEDKVRRIFELAPRYWRIEINPLGTYIIAFDSRKIDMDNFDGYWVRIEGQVQPAIAGTDNAAIPADLEEYIITGASMQLAAQRMDETETWRRKFYMFRDDFRPLEDYIWRTGRGTRVG